MALKLSVIIPVYNEENTILQVINKVQQVLSQLPHPSEIITVDDGSKDSTTAKLRTIDSAKYPSVKIFYHEKNRGKGAAIRTAIPHCTGDVILIQDADLELDPNDYPELIKPIVSGKSDVVYGSRFIKNPPKVKWRSKFANFAVTFAANTLYGIRITDEAAGYKIFRAPVLKNMTLRCERFEFCPEVTAKVAKQGYKICEVPVSFNPRSTQQGKKVGWKDGFEAIWTLLKYRFTD